MQIYQLMLLLSKKHVPYFIRSRILLYIREGLHFDKLHNLSTFHEKTFECLTVELQYPNKKIIVFNIYRSPNPPPRYSPTEHLNQFLLLFNNHLESLNNWNTFTFVFLDSNINLHQIHSDPSALNYLNSILSNGFIQVITRLTRVQGPSRSLIDHVLINRNFNENYAVTLAPDLSDHFINFQQLDSPCNKIAQKLISSRKFCPENIDRFKTLLNGTNWSNVTTQTMSMWRSMLLLLVLLYRMLPDITSNTWAKKHFYNFL